MTTRKPLYVAGDAVLRQLRAEAMLESRCDDDRPSVPDPDDSTISAQARRLAVAVNA